MAVRLRPQSSAWLAPTALAAQLTAQTGQIAGQGVAGLLGGIAQGVGAFTQKREQRRVEAINESRYQDSLRMRQADDARQDRSFQYGAVRDQMALNNEFKTGAELAFALDPTPENKMKPLRDALDLAASVELGVTEKGGEPDKARTVRALEDLAFFCRTLRRGS